MSRRRSRPLSPRQSRGAAALIVVLVLFFLVSLVAAYTSRSMIFEQRTSTNQMRSTQAIEVAEAGIEWAITKLNAGLINGGCATDPAGASTFRQRYLSFAPTTGNIDAVAGTSATCVVQPGTGWACNCPTAGSSIPATTGDGPFPAFRVHFERDRGVARQNLIRVTVSSCTNATAGCLSNPQVPEPGQGNASVSANLGLKGAVDTLPAAAVTIPAATTVAASLTLTGGSLLSAFNTAQSGSGIAVQTGGTLPVAGVTVVGAPGMPAQFARVESDLSLSAQAGNGGIRNSSDAGACPAGDTHLGCSFNRMFASVFGAPRATFRAQPGLVRCTGGCDSSALAVLATRNPRSVLLVAGNATLDANLGSVGNPVALVVEGDVTLSGAAVVTGSIYSTSGTWTVTGTPIVLGAMVSETAVTMSGGGILEVRYDPVVLAKLRSEYGSFVRVPGGWRDWQP